MARWIRRFVALVLIGAAAAAALRAARARRAAASIPLGGTPEWPPFEKQSAAPPTEVAPVSANGAPSWMAPVNGGCPDGYPIKANSKSRIFHVPNGQFYGRSVPERCYATAEDAERDGYRQAKA